MLNKYKQIVYVLFMSTLALGYGQSIQELQKLKMEYEKFQKDQKLLKISTNVGEDFDFDTSLPGQAQIATYKPDEFTIKSEDIKLNHYGYDFFTRRDTVAFWENLPAPSNYLLGPGDELVISLWGETQLRESYTISRDGKIYDEKVGLLNLTGKSISDARKYLKDQYGRIYATLKGQKATTFMDVSLGELRSINVNFVGQVKYPGIYPIHPFSTVITGLIQAGGVDTTGSLRRIQIKRVGFTEKPIDLYNYFINGDVSSIIQLRDQDIVVIPPRLSVVKIDSAVINPGIYESTVGETIYDLIQHAGGQKSNASETVGIHMLKPKSERTNGVSYEARYVDFDSTKLISADNVNHIAVHYLFNEKQLVEIIGQVKVPGIYHYYKGMTFKSLLSLGGGFEDSTFWKSVYQSQAEIIRRDPQSRYEKVIKVNLNDIYNVNIKKDIPLQNLDRVVIHANLNYFEKENILLLGEVNIPGSYPIISDNESLESFLKRAGGLTSKALENGMAIYRENDLFDTNVSNSVISIESNTTTNVTNKKIRVAWQNTNIILMPGDSIIVRESSGTVNVSGEVYNQGLIEFESDKSLKHYINAAGGITPMGNKNDIIVIYANGVVSPKKFMNSPIIKEGSTIIVNQKEIKQPINVAQFATSILSIISTTVTILVLSQQLNPNN